MTSNVAETLQNEINQYYPNGPSDIECLRFYANLAIRSLFYAEAQGVLNEDVVKHLARQANQAEQKLALEEEAQEDAND